MFVWRCKGRGRDDDTMKKMFGYAHSVFLLFFLVEGHENLVLSDGEVL